MNFMDLKDLNEELEDAIFQKDLAKVQELLSRDDINLYNGEQLLNYAINTNQVEIVKLFLSHNGVTLYDNQLLNDAIRNKQLEIVKLLLSHDDIDVNSADVFGESLLSNAVKNNDIELVKLLLEHKNINVNVINLFGYSPLYMAVKNNDIELVKLLLEHKNINVNSNTYVISLLSQAIENKNIEIVKLLVENKNIDLNNIFSNGKDILNFALKEKEFDIAKIILEKLDVVDQDTFANIFSNFKSSLKVIKDYASQITKDLILEAGLSYEQEDLVYSLINEAFSEDRMMETKSKIDSDTLKEFAEKYELYLPLLNLSACKISAEILEQTDLSEEDKELVYGCKYAQQRASKKVVNKFYYLAESDEIELSGDVDDHHDGE